jgi:S-adenosylmethionine decarboxylase
MSKVATRETVAESAVLTHVMLDMYGVNAETLNDPNAIGDILTGAATAAALHPLAEPAVYRYPGQGLTVFLPIRESHFAIHTYPEHGYASVDIVSCARAERARRASDFIVDRLEPDRSESDVVYRGFLQEREA